MDHQDPRLTGERLSGRADRDVYGLDRPGRESRVAELTIDDEAEGSDAAATTTPDRRTRAIKAEIDQARDDMSETVNAIQERLRPASIAANAADSVKHAALDKARDIAESDSVMYVRANPMATVMLGVGVVGLTWMLVGGRDGRSSRQKLAQGNGTAGYGTKRQGQIGPALDQQRQHARSETQQFTAYAENAAQRAWNQSPLLVGAACAVLGAIVGLTVPETDREHQLMGETRDQVMDTVHEAVRDKVTEVKHAATEAVSTVQNAAKRAAGLPSADDEPTNDEGRGARRA